MKKSRIIFSPFVLDKISNSSELKNIEKIQFFKYLWYMTETEKNELMKIV